MGNRADRRAAAKIARQAVKRAKSPTEGAILRAAASFAAEEAPGQIGSCLSNADFDEAWLRLTEDLHDILEDQYPDFLTQAYAEAGLGVVDGEGGTGTRLFLCPVAGAAERLAGFASDAKEIGRLEASLREAGIVAEGARCLVLPLMLPIDAFAPDATRPGRVRRLHDELRGLLTETAAGNGARSSDNIRAALSDLAPMASDASGAGTAFGALVGIELVPGPSAVGADTSDEELDAEDIARAAAADSWYDSYAADIEGMMIGLPVDWPACGAALAWETIRLPMEAALRRHGVPEGRAETIHCATVEDGSRLVVSAVAGSVAVGPFSAPGDLVWLDAEEFFARAEASAERFMEHDGEGGVIAPLLGTA